MRTRLAPIALAAVLLASLTACNPFTDPYEDQQRDGGVTPASAENELLAIDGISDAEYGTYEWYNPGEGGLFSSSGMDVVLTVTVDPEYSVADDAAFLDYLAATAWSVNDHYPKGSVVIQVIGGADANYGWLSVAHELFPTLKSFRTPQSAGYDVEDAEWYRGGRTLAVGAEAYGERFGRWPSDPVEAPSGLLAHQPVIPILEPAITDLRLVVSDGSKEGQSCYYLTFVRSGEYVTYYGAVTSVLRSESGDELQTELGSANTSYEFFCFDDAVFPEGVSVDVSTGEFADHEFIPVTETVYPE